MRATVSDLHMGTAKDRSELRLILLQEPIYKEGFMKEFHGPASG